MPAQENIDKVKVVLKLDKGSQTIGECQHGATADDLLAIGQAVSDLVSEPVERIAKVVESTIINA